MLSQRIQKFLNHKLGEQQISKKTLAEKMQTVPSVVSNIANGYKTNIELKTLLKLAKVFQCSVDEVCGRNPIYYSKEHTSVSEEEIMPKLRDFLNHQISIHGITAQELERQIKFSPLSIASFTADNPTKQSLGSVIVVKIADYFKVSVDEMIGRVERAPSLNQDASKDKISSIVASMTSEDLVDFKSATKSFSSNLSKSQEGHAFTSSNPPSAKPKNIER